MSFINYLETVVYISVVVSLFDLNFLHNSCYIIKPFLWYPTDN